MREEVQGKAMTEPPCPRCGQPMTARDLGESDEYQCKPCQFALAPLSMMTGENRGTEQNHSIAELAHLNELEEWLEEQLKGTP